MPKAKPRATNVAAHPAAPRTPPRCEGQRLLRVAAAGVSLADLARKIGCKSRDTCHQWLWGSKSPSDDARAKIEAAFPSVPADSWSRELTAAVGGVPTPDLRATLESASLTRGLSPELPTTPIEHVNELLRFLRAERLNQAVLRGERIRLAAAETRLLALKQQLHIRNELSEDRYVREHPAWLRIRNELARVLVKFPAAASAVAEALEQLGDKR